MAGAIPPSRTGYVGLDILACRALGGSRLPSPAREFGVDANGHVEAVFECQYIGLGQEEASLIGAAGIEQRLSGAGIESGESFAVIPPPGIDDGGIQAIRARQFRFAR